MSTEIMSTEYTDLSEVAIVLASGDDAEDLEKATEFYCKASEQESARNSEMKKCVKALAKLKERETKAHMLRVAALKENDEVVLGLESKKGDKTANIENLNGEVGTAEEAMKQAEMSASKVEEAKAEILHENVEVLPKIKYAFSLYSNITHIRWDYDSEEDQLKGFVASIHDVRPFSLNSKENTKYFIANYLWDVIDSCKI